VSLDNLRQTYKSLSKKSLAAKEFLTNPPLFIY
jgi:hypothetical protein